MINKFPRVLVACEFSGIVSTAFRKVGAESISADLLFTEGDPTYHHIVDGRDPTQSLFDLIRAWRPDLVIAHPPCTNLTLASARWLADHGRRAALRRDAEFFRMFLELDVPHIAVENPIMLREASDIIGRRHDQIVHPYQFGHLERKSTSLWLKGLPPLVATSDLKAETMALPAKERDKVHWMAPGPDRWRARSRTYTGIAAAMAGQWTAHIRGQR